MGPLREADVSLSGAERPGHIRSHGAPDSAAAGDMTTHHQQKLKVRTPEKNNNF